MGALQELVRSLIYFLGVNLIFFALTISILAFKTYFVMNTVPMEMVVTILTVWPQP